MRKSSYVSCAEGAIVLNKRFCNADRFLCTIIRNIRSSLGTLVKSSSLVCGVRTSNSQSSKVSVNMLLGVDHYSRLWTLGSGWKQRSVINASLTGQVNQVFNGPLTLESMYGLNEWKNSLNNVGADVRATLRAESVFFSPYTFINFHFAPFVFANFCMMTPVKENLNRSDLYSSIGGGIRTRNESLVFGTFELRVFYFPRKTFTGEAWRIETNTGIRFKYNSQQIKRPDLINVN